MSRAPDRRRIRFGSTSRDAPEDPSPGRLKRYVLTGAPGSGKTSILRVLREDRRYAVIGEAATDMIAREQAHGHDEPRKDTRFVDRILALQRQRQDEEVPADVVVQVFDRSPLCTLASAHFLGQVVQDALTREIDRIVHERIYERRVSSSA